jgi:hypothetical protein
MFVSTFQLVFPIEKLKSQKQKQTMKNKTGFWNTEKQVSKELN